MIDKATTRRGLSEPVRPEGPLNRAHAGLSAAARFMARVGGASLLAMAFVIVFEVFARKFFGFTITGIDETAGFVYACAMAWGFAFALFERAHIRVDLVHSQLPRGIQHILDATGLALMLGLAIFLCYRAYLLLEKSLSLKAVSPSPLQTPMWLPQGVWFVGLVFFAICVLVAFLCSLKWVFTGAGQKHPPSRQSEG